MQNKRIIIFGAGNYGKSALEYYGKENVEYFADNNQEKVGGLYCEKKILSFEELIKIADEYRIVIACTFFGEMENQLNEKGINNYIVYRPSITHMVDILQKKMKLDTDANIYLYGVCNETNDIIGALSELGYKDCIKGAIKCKYDSDNTVDLNIKVYSEIEDLHMKTCFIIAEPRNNLSLSAELKIKYKDATIINPYKQIAYYDTDELIVNPYSMKESDTTEQEWIDITNGAINKAEIRNFVDTVKNNVPLFEYVEIETINRCNGSCSFCPVNRRADPRKELKMDRILFNKIIDELSDMNYQGELSLFSNNEPLLDERIIDLHKYAREKLPNARIHMFTNGTLLTVSLFKELIDYLDELIIDNYRQDLKLITPVQKIEEYINEHLELKKKVTIVLRKPNEILTSRGGDAPNREKLVSYERETCALPFEQLIIRPDGKVSLCCNDPIGKNTMGDVTKDSLKNIWYGSEFSMVRKCLSEGRKNWKHCEYCDTFYIY